MRELKFRIWSEEDKEYRSDIRVSDLVIDIDGAPSTIYSAEGDRFDIEQYTGLKDKNGEEIYEGDIVRYGNDNAAIIWRERNAEFGVKWLDCGVEDSISWQIGIEKMPSEVIGNIHENADLLGDTNVTNKEEE